jgi:hypothetical protein
MCKISAYRGEAYAQYNLLNTNCGEARAEEAEETTQAFGKPASGMSAFIVLRWCKMCR